MGDVPHRYPMVLEPLSESDGGGFLATVPDLPGCVSDGASPEEAIANVVMAIAEWRDEAARLGRHVPLPFSSHPRRAATTEAIPPVRH